MMDKKNSGALYCGGGDGGGLAGRCLDVPLSFILIQFLAEDFKIQICMIKGQNVSTCCISPQPLEANLLGRLSPMSSDS